jgi:hypothetical protein
VGGLRSKDAQLPIKILVSQEIKWKSFLNSEDEKIALDAANIYQTGCLEKLRKPST